MTHDELLAKIDASGFMQGEDYVWSLDGQAVKKSNAALRAVVELHKPVEGNEHLCSSCLFGDFLQAYPCITIQTIEKELSSQP